MARVYKEDKTWFQDFRDQFRSLDGQPFKKKVEHFITYYWRLTALIIFLIIFIVSMTISIIRNSKPVIIQGVFYPNIIGEEASDKLKTELADIMGVNAAKYRIDVASLVTDQENSQQVQAALQVIAARIMGKDIDFFCSDESTIKTLLVGEDETEILLSDLSTILKPETYQRLSEAGRIMTAETSYGQEGEFYIDIQGSYLAELTEVTGKEKYVGFIVNSENIEGFEALCALIR